MSQKETVLKHLREGESITALQAMEQYGIGRLAARVHELREEGYPIADRTVEKRNRNGEPVRYAEYFLEGQGELVL